MHVLQTILKQIIPNFQSILAICHSESLHPYDVTNRHCTHRKGYLKFYVDGRMTTADKAL